MPAIFFREKKQLHCTNFLTGVRSWNMSKHHEPLTKNRYLEASNLPHNIFCAEKKNMVYIVVSITASAADFKMSSNRVATSCIQAWFIFHVFSKRKIHSSHTAYCWWTKSCTSWYGRYLSIHRVLYISTGAGFLRSTAPRGYPFNWWSPFFVDPSRNFPKTPTSMRKLQQGTHPGSGGRMFFLVSGQPSSSDAQHDVLRLFWYQSFGWTKNPSITAFCLIWIFNSKDSV